MIQVYLGDEMIGTLDVQVHPGQTDIKLMSFRDFERSTTYSGNTEVVVSDVIALPIRSRKARSIVQSWQVERGDATAAMIARHLRRHNNVPDDAIFSANIMPSTGEIEHIFAWRVAEVSNDNVELVFDYDGFTPV